MKKTSINAEQRARLETAARASDESIDTDDIPEIPASAALYSRGSKLYRPLKQPVTIRLDVDVVSWFKDHAGDKPYQSEINQVLRSHVAAATKQEA